MFKNYRDSQDREINAMKLAALGSLTIATFFVIGVLVFTSLSSGPTTKATNPALSTTGQGNSANPTPSTPSISIGE